uniref:p4 n=1 Tax=Malus domestica virus A TaxID=2664236 RepID=A0A6M3RHR8_9CLOS|nr:p4 [Malus domestica virus A]
MIDWIICLLVILFFFIVISPSNSGFIRLTKKGI